MAGGEDAFYTRWTRNMKGGANRDMYKAVSDGMLDNLSLKRREHLGFCTHQRRKTKNTLYCVLLWDFIV